MSSNIAIDGFGPGVERLLALTLGEGSAAWCLKKDESENVALFPVGTVIMACFSLNPLCMRHVR